MANIDIEQDSPDTIISNLINELPKYIELHTYKLDKQYHELMTAMLNDLSDALIVSIKPLDAKLNIVADLKQFSSRNKRTYSQLLNNLERAIKQYERYYKQLLSGISLQTYINRYIEENKISITDLYDWNTEQRNIENINRLLDAYNMLKKRFVFIHMLPLSSADWYPWNATVMYLMKKDEHLFKIWCSDAYNYCSNKPLYKYSSEYWQMDKTTPIGKKLARCLTEHMFNYNMQKLHE